MVDRLVLRNTEHRKLSADNGARPGEDVKVLLPDQLPRVDGHAEGHRPSEVKAATVEHRPTGRRVHSRLALSRKSAGFRPTYTIQPGPFGPGGHC